MNVDKSVIVKLRRHTPPNQIQHVCMAFRIWLARKLTNIRGPGNPRNLRSGLLSLYSQLYSALIRGQMLRHAQYLYQKRQHFKKCGRLLYCVMQTRTEASRLFEDTIFKEVLTSLIERGSPLSLDDALKVLSYLRSKRLTILCALALLLRHKIPTITKGPVELIPYFDSADCSVKTLVMGLVQLDRKDYGGANQLIQESGFHEGLLCLYKKIAYGAFGIQKEEVCSMMKQMILRGFKKAIQPYIRYFVVQASTLSDVRRAIRDIDDGLFGSEPTIGRIRQSLVARLSGLIRKAETKVRRLEQRLKKANGEHQRAVESIGKLSTARQTNAVDQLQKKTEDLLAQLNDMKQQAATCRLLVSDAFESIRLEKKRKRASCPQGDPAKRPMFSESSQERK
jgi:hypothetical protein